MDESGRLRTVRLQVRVLLGMPNSAEAEFFCLYVKINNLAKTYKTSHNISII